MDLAAFRGTPCGSPAIEWLDVIAGPRSEPDRALARYDMTRSEDSHVLRFAELVRYAAYGPALATIAVLSALAAAPAVAQDADTLPDHASPSACVVIIRLAIQSSAVADDQVEALQAAEKSFREMSVELNNGTEGSNQMIGSSVAFFDQLSPEQLREGADMCLSAVDDDFDADE